MMMQIFFLTFSLHTIVVAFLYSACLLCMLSSIKNAMPSIVCNYHVLVLLLRNIHIRVLKAHEVCRISKRNKLINRKGKSLNFNLELTVEKLNDFAEPSHPACSCHENRKRPRNIKFLFQRLQSTLNL